MKTIKSNCIAIVMCWALASSFFCEAQLPDINTAHLDHLYEEVLLETGDTVGVIHIYSEFPDYHYVGDDDEGIACIDDATRAAIFYLQEFMVTGKSAHMIKARKLMEFVLALQSSNGYFYNFIWEDHTIHKTGITTVAEPNWWSWRALWCMTEFVESGLYDSDPLGPRITAAREKLVRAMLKEELKIGEYEIMEGIQVPQWLPGGNAADQASLIIMGLSPMLRESNDTELQNYVENMRNGVMHLQVESPGNWFDGAFMCWGNLWHGYGSSQAYALLKSYKVIKNEKALNGAIREIEYFYPALKSMGWASSFNIRKSGDHFEAYNLKEFDQIAYGLRPAIFASTEAYVQTGDERYRERATELFKWFSGDNPADVQIYDPATGIVFDGIGENGVVNKNSGAESTIEALLALQKLHSISKD